MRLTYAEFFDRCDRWSAALQALGVGKGDRVAYIAPNTHGHLEAYYAVPQIGAVVVPINYRLTPDDFVYLISHSGSRVVCAHADHLDAIDQVRPQLSGVEHFVALEGGAGRSGWLTETVLRGAMNFDWPVIDEATCRRSNTQRNHLAAERVMITHRNAYMNAVGTLIHHPRRARSATSGPSMFTRTDGHSSDRDRRGGTHICLRGWSRPASLGDHPRAGNDALRRSYGADRDRQRPRGAASRAPAAFASSPRSAPPAATIERVEDLGRELTQVYGLTETGTVHHHLSRALNTPSCATSAP
jgi:fatty-acyl-CoA synthase